MERSGVDPPPDFRAECYLTFDVVVHSEKGSNGNAIGMVSPDLKACLTPNDTLQCITLRQQTYI